MNAIEKIAGSRGFKRTIRAMRAARPSKGTFFPKEILESGSEPIFRKKMLSLGERMRRTGKEKKLAKPATELSRIFQEEVMPRGKAGYGLYTPYGKNIKRSTLIERMKSSAGARKTQSYQKKK